MRYMNYEESMAHYGLDRWEFDDLLDNGSFCHSCYHTVDDCQWGEYIVCLEHAPRILNRYGLGIWT